MSLGGSYSEGLYGNLGPTSDEDGVLHQSMVGHDVAIGVPISAGPGNVASLGAALGHSQIFSSALDGAAASTSMVSCTGISGMDNVY